MVDKLALGQVFLPVFWVSPANIIYELRKPWIETHLGFLGAFPELRKATIRFLLSVRPSVPMEQFGSHWTDFQDILYLIFFENLSRKFKFHYNLARIAGTLHEYQ